MVFNKSDSHLFPLGLMSGLFDIAFEIEELFLVINLNLRNIELDFIDFTCAKNCPWNKIQPSDLKLNAPIKLNQYSYLCILQCWLE